MAKIKEGEKEKKKPEAGESKAEKKAPAKGKPVKEGAGKKESPGKAGGKSAGGAEKEKTGASKAGDETSKKKAGEKKTPKQEEKPSKKEKEEEKVDIVSEDVYTIPLRKVYRTKPSYKRANKAVQTLLAYLRKHTKTENVKLDDSLNRRIWSRGASKPPRSVQVKAVKDSEGRVLATLL